MDYLIVIIHFITSKTKIKNIITILFINCYKIGQIAVGNSGEEPGDTNLSTDKNFHEFYARWF